MFTGGVEEPAPPPALGPARERWFLWHGGCILTIFVGLASRMILLATSVICLAGGCAAHEQVGRPPSAVEIGRINSFADEHGPMRVEPLDPLPSCAGGGCEGRDVALAQHGLVVPDQAHIASCDERHITFTTEAGGAQTLPLAAVAGISSRDRGRGALVGAAVGATTMVTAGLLVGLALSNVSPSDPGLSPPNSCTACDVAKVSALLAIEGALTGALLGYIIGSRRVFELGSASPSSR